ncbi:MAG: DinB family protein [Capsulimonas sp.]|uniref:DinB family protein n=1 Tax=Capsulimonas sp. TaxID=2494211 RepID=UPI0032645C16
MSIVTAPSVTDSIALAVRRMGATKSQLLKTFAHVPDDKLQWSPTPTCRTPLQIVAHCAYVNGVVAGVLMGETDHARTSVEEGRRQTLEFEAMVMDREQALTLLEKSCADVLGAIATMTAERFVEPMESRFGPIPASFWMLLPSTHMSNHAAQIDYIQTAWGDLDNHF